MTLTPIPHPSLLPVHQEFEDGFLIRRLSTKGLNWNSVSPTMAELERFKAGLGAEVRNTT
jgi:hypothetical protein